MDDQTFVFKTELDFSDLFAVGARERINRAVEVELNSLLRFAGSEEPEGRCTKRQYGPGAGRYLNPVFDRVERNFEEHAFASDGTVEAFRESNSCSFAPGG
jgi:hypothetical protein